MCIFHAEILCFDANGDVFRAGLGDGDVGCVDVRDVNFVAGEDWDCNSSVEVVLL
jgi:hypothetical protein